MQKVSRNNYYYRYKINGLQDLNLETIERRIKKAQQNLATILFIDWTDFNTQDSFLFLKTSRQFLKEILQSSQHLNLKFDLLLKPKQLEILLQNSEVNQFLKENMLTVHLQNKADVQSFFQLSLKHLTSSVLLNPQTKTDLQQLVDFPRHNFEHSWDFNPYQPQLKNSLTIKDLIQTNIFFQRRHGLEVWNSNIPMNYELEALQPLTWKFSSPNPQPEISLIIPSFNNAAFLSNVILHLTQQNVSADRFEVIVVEDGGTDNTSEILKDLWSTYKDKFNLKFIYWPKIHPQQGPQNFFRAGLARNLASQYSEAEFLFFLDSDMLTPPNFIETALAALKKNDVIQFQRFHIKQDISQNQPIYKNISADRDTYIEEANYWNQLFTSPDWMSLKHHWKFTCTYALGLKKSDFLEVGRFKKYYVSYGFEDTDLGYELFLRKKKFLLVQTPLFHLTSYNQMQYQNSQIKRLQLLRKTAELFYLQHLNSEIYHLFGNFYRFQKKLPQYFRDLF